MADHSSDLPSVLRALAQVIRDEADAAKERLALARQTADLAQQLIRQQQPDDADPTPRLSKREALIVQAVGDGEKTADQIARDLNLEPSGSFRADCTALARHGLLRALDGNRGYARTARGAAALAASAAESDG